MDKQGRWSFDEGSLHVGSRTTEALFICSMAVEGRERDHVEHAGTGGSGDAKMLRYKRRANKGQITSRDRRQLKAG